MFANRSLGTRIGFGFLSIVLIACGLGALASYTMRQVEHVAEELARERVPAVSIANDVERWSLLTMYAARGYVFNENVEFKDTAEENLRQVKKFLVDAKTHAEEFNNSAMKANVAQATEQASRYELYFGETIKAMDVMDKDKRVFLEAADQYLAVCYEFQKGQLATLDAEVTEAFDETKAGVAPAANQERVKQGAPDTSRGSGQIDSGELRERIRKVVLCNEVIDLGNAIRTGTWLAIATHDPERLPETQKTFEGIYSRLDSLKAICRIPEDLKRIEECRAAGKAFSDGMTSFLLQWRVRLDEDKKRGKAAQEVLDAAKSTARVNIVAVEERSSEAAKQLAQASFTMTFGLIAGAAVALLLAFRIVVGIRRPLGELTKAATLASNGEICQRIDCEEGGELGLLADSFRKLNGFFGEITDKAGSIAEGDFSVDIVPRSDKDVIGRALSEMTRTLRAVADTASRVAVGDFSAEVVLKSERDELGRAINLMNAKLRAASEEFKAQDWMKSGAAGLAIELQGAQDLFSLSRAAITYLAKYIGAQMGSLYVIDEDMKTLVLHGSYAFNKRKSVNDRILIGEGIAGQAALEKELISITDIPLDYARITSSLGEAPPTNVLTAPFLHEGQLIGVVELASFKTFSDAEMAFLTGSLESIAIAAIAAKSRAKLTVLLQESQEQAEELQAQTEEMATQQEELRSVNEELEQQSEELRASNEELEEKSEALERQKAEIEERTAEVEKAKRDVEAKVRELELSSTYKSEFLANMSHELRTPLNSLLILAKLLTENESGNLTNEQVESANIIYSGGQDLLFLINEILDLSKVEAGMMEVHWEEVSLDAIVSAMRQQFQIGAKDKGLAFDIAIAPTAPSTIVTDGRRLEQILRNFLSNAFKFTAEGSVVLSIERPTGVVSSASGRLTRENTVAFSVRDTGPGIPKDKHRAIFEAFQQADGSTSRQYGGTGLGLSISLALSHLLNGEIQLESEPGKGSLFTLLLPLERRNASVEECVASPKDEERMQRRAVRSDRLDSRETPIREFIPDDRNSINESDRSVLIIEDDAPFSRILMTQVRRRGFKCLSAGDGDSGLRLARQYKPCAIILDLGLPDVDGATVLDTLKYNLGTRHIPVHIMSARDKSAELLQKGAMGFLTKPVNAEDIDAALGKIEGLLLGSARNVLVVEDDDSSLKAIEALLASESVRITGARSGAEAHQLLAQYRFDCVILDLGLSDMTGFELLRQADANPAIKLPPIIVYTGKELTSGELQRLGEYTTNVVVKGANSPERLLDEVSLFLHMVETSFPKEHLNTLRVMHDPERLLRDRKLLLVDDDLRNSFALSTVLKKAGLKVLMAENGAVALDILAKDNEIEIVLMDIMMPIMDGYEAIAKIREQPHFKNLPIVALTAKAMVEDRAKCIQAGANDYLAKPIDVEKLVSLMRVLLFR